MENGHHDCASKTQVNAMEVRQLVDSEGQGINSNVDRNSSEARLAGQIRGDHVEDVVERVGFQNLDATRGEGAQGRAETERFGFQNLDKADRAQNSILGKVGHAEDWIRSDVRHESDKLSAQADRNDKSIEKEVRFYGHENAEAIGDGFKDSLLQNCGHYGNILLDSSKNAAAAALAACDNTYKIMKNDDGHFRDVLLQAANNASSLQASIANGVCKIELQAANNVAAVQLEAAKNKCSIELDAAKHAAEIAKQVAECCCEVRMLINDKSCKTDELIRSVDGQRIRDELNSTRDELIALRIRASLVPAPVASVPL